MSLSLLINIFFALCLANILIGCAGVDEKFTIPVEISDDGQDDGLNESSDDDSDDGSDDGFDTDIPSSISNLLVRYDEDNYFIRLDWQDNSINEMGFIIERKENLGVWVKQVNTIEDVTFFVDSNISRGNRYQYRVKAFNGIGESDYVESEPIDVLSMVTFEESVAIQSVFDPTKCFTIDTESLMLGQSVILADCNNVEGQRWFKDSIDRWHPEVSQDICISASLQNHGDLYLEDCVLSASSQWQMIESSIRQGEYAVDLVRETFELVMYSFHGGPNQQWKLVDPAILDSNSDNASNENGNANNVGDWTFVSVEPNKTYGTKHFNVPAAQNWVNTGLYLRKGQTATISAIGEWRLKAGNLYGPEGSGSDFERGCLIGSLTARTGLYYKSEIQCVGDQSVITAVNEGIVYIGGIVSTDLGETYETRKNASGSLEVTVSSQGDTVPTVYKDDVATYDFDLVNSGWVEVLGEHTILTLPSEIAKADAAEIRQSVEMVDDIYRQHKILRDIAPYHDQPIRWFPDTEDAPGWMLAGNPVRMDPALVYNANDRITRAARADRGNWGFAHELGHDFNFAGGEWYYTTNVGLEVWPNIFSVHAQEALGLPLRDLDCENKSNVYLNSGTFENDFKGWTALCFLMEFKDDFGWQFYKNFYKDFNRSSGHGWAFLRKRFSDAAGKDMNSIFDKWKLPKE